MTLLDAIASLRSVKAPKHLRAKVGYFSPSTDHKYWVIYCQIYHYKFGMWYGIFNSFIQNGGCSKSVTEMYGISWSSWSEFGFN